MTVRIVLTSAAVAVALGACATGSGGNPNSYRAEMDRLTADCIERGGVLTPTGATTGLPQTEYFCRISGGASRIQ